MTLLKARHAMGSKVTGTALVANDGFSARYDLDRINGVFHGPRTSWLVDLTLIEF